MAVQAARTRRINEVLAVALAVAAVWWAVQGIASGQPAGLQVALGAVLWAWWVGMLLAGEWVVLRLTGRGPPALPLTGQPMGPGLLAGAVALVGVVGLLREGVAEPALGLDLDWYTLQANTEVEREHRVRGAPSLGLEGTYVTCDVKCEPDGVACASFHRWLRCDDEMRPRPSVARTTEATVRVRGLGDPWCYMPLVTRVEAMPEVRVELESSGKKGAHVMRLEPRVRHTAYGFVACHTLRRRLGHGVAQVVAEQIQKEIQRH